MTQDEIIEQPIPSQSDDGKDAYIARLETLIYRIRNHDKSYVQHEWVESVLASKPASTSLTSQDWLETIKELQKFTDELGIIGMVGSLAWKARIKQAITNEGIEKPRTTSQEVLDAERLIVNAILWHDAPERPND